MKQVWKRRAVVAAVLMLVGTSVYLNWRYTGNVENSGKKVLGQSALVNAEMTAAGDDYFATARLSRKQARDTAISMLQEAQVDENAAEDVLNEASQTLQVLAAYTVAESQIESLVVAKGYADCVAFMGEDAISVVVSDPDGLDAVVVARIKDIVVSETSYTPDQIRIMEAGAGASAASQTGSTQEAEAPASAAQTDEQADDAK